MCSSLFNCYWSRPPAKLESCSPRGNFMQHLPCGDSSPSRDNREFCRNVEGTLKHRLLIFSIAKAQSVLLVCLRGYRVQVYAAKRSFCSSLCRFEAFFSVSSRSRLSSSIRSPIFESCSLPSPAAKSSQGLSES